MIEDNLQKDLDQLRKWYEDKENSKGTFIFGKYTDNRLDLWNDELINEEIKLMERDSKRGLPISIERNERLRNEIERRNNEYSSNTQSEFLPLERLNINNKEKNMPLDDYERETMSTEQILARQESHNPYDDLQKNAASFSSDEFEKIEEKATLGNNFFMQKFGRIPESKNEYDAMVKTLNQNEIAYLQKLSESPSPERRNINSKEKNMSDVNENDGQTRDPKEEAFLNTVHQRKVITDALKAGKLSCLPGTNGFADTTPAVNLVNGTFYHGTNLLFLKEHQKENGFPSAEYVTLGQIEKAKKDNPDLFIRQGQKGVSIYVSEKNEETGEWENKNFRLFNVAQTTRPAVMKEWAEQQRQEKLQEKLEYLQTQYGTGYKLPEPKQKEPGPEIVCASTDPEKYLGQYLAAVSMGGKFKASPEQASEFAQKLEGTLFERMENGHTNPFKLEKISNEASKYCKVVIRETQIEAQKQNQPQQEQTQSQSRGR